VVPIHTASPRASGIGRNAGGRPPTHPCASRRPDRSPQVGRGGSSPTKWPVWNQLRPGTVTDRAGRSGRHEHQGSPMFCSTNPLRWLRLPAVRDCAWVEARFGHR